MVTTNDISEFAFNFHSVRLINSPRLRLATCPGRSLHRRDDDSFPLEFAEACTASLVIHFQSDLDLIAGCVRDGPKIMHNHQSIQPFPSGFICLLRAFVASVVPGADIE